MGRPFCSSYSALQHKTPLCSTQDPVTSTPPPIPHIALWRTRPFWAAHMMSKGRPLFCTEILLRPFAARGCSLQEVGLLYNEYNSKVVLNLPTIHKPSLQHTITLSKYNTPLSRPMTFARHWFPLQHSRPQIQSFAKPGTPLWNILVDNLNMA